MDKNKPVEKPLIHNLKNTNNSMFTKRLFIFLIIAVVLGGITGYLLSNKAGRSMTSTNGSVSSSLVSKGTILGSNDTKTFKDTVSGVLKAGGINGEGQFHLVRPGGDSQNVYMTSTSVDLAKLIGRKIKVWGQTQKAQYGAGWLMDVGRIEVLE
ncbi:MAG: hypothetical protein Q7R51_00325 [bacterium]|nr:hypothetical protein [bacterium]